ncbi:MAG: HU family DNA-binding protein [bacterium]|nr:HU family DNA-binding protein [bacterium]MBK8127500.1 HU family DNA-binding protein [bacterium]
MTQRELIAAVCARTALPDQTVREMLQVVVATIQDAVWDGDKVTINNFGSFYLAERKARAVATPETPAPPATRKYPKFAPAPYFEELVR